MARVRTQPARTAFEERPNWIERGKSAMHTKPECAGHALPMIESEYCASEMNRNEHLINFISAL